MRVAVAVLALLVSGSVAGQAHPFEPYVGHWLVASSTIEAPNADISFNSIAKGRGLHSVWRHGAGDTYYEAHALWGYDPRTGRVEVLEVNSAGVVGHNIGFFDSSGALTAERRNSEGLVIERRLFRMAGTDTMHITLEFIRPERVVRHETTLVRR